MGRLLALLLAGLVVQPAGYRAEVEAFRKQRAVEVGGENGWASLVGLHWLVPGVHTIGRAASSAIVLTAPSSPDELGTLTVRADGATLQVAAGVTARLKDRPVRTVELRPNTADGVVSVGGMTIALIKRGSRLALRVWDLESSGRKRFTGLRWYPIDPAWRVDATFVPHQPAPNVRIVNILGETVAMANPGYVEFVIAGHTCRLEALLESEDAKELFFMFRDETSHTTTYGAGRYLYTDLPKDGHVVLDFNRAKNPPCAFTDFATCPLPPPRNRLALQVLAGELNDGHGH